MKLLHSPIEPKPKIFIVGPLSGVGYSFKVVAARFAEIKYVKTLCDLTQIRCEHTGCILISIDCFENSSQFTIHSIIEILRHIPIVIYSKNCLFSLSTQVAHWNLPIFASLPICTDRLIKILNNLFETSQLIIDRISKSFEAKHKMLKLTNREKQVFKFIASGYTNSMIASKLSLSVGTIDFHRNNIKSKLSVSSLAEIIDIKNRLMY